MIRRDCSTASNPHWLKPVMDAGVHDEMARGILDGTGKTSIRSILERQPPGDGAEGGAVPPEA